ncbi:HAD-IIA family hydrolase [Bifidobacterium sp. ESL0790]|uniref:HAD-IIA family hydrolase n=1 Tax=Bifidobacterium sp. ESL0790 TaxID=2983233 RepID=UPI0023F89E6D|nr:HAD-IIA family hydrolase [Bifidobacterium sp. ESL0790]WEV71795.1 HAD-IIA family hydrolase [Bifidobacterium sp. ESL0790]
MLKGTRQPLSQAYGLALLDLDGVVYRGKLPVAHAAQSIRDAESAGMVVEYTTNNSSRDQATVADQLKGFDLDVEPHQIITSSIVAARMVAHAFPQGSKVIMSGAPHLREEIERQGLTLVDHVENGPVAAIQGWCPTMTWNALANIAFAVEHGAEYYVTNRDLTIPRELGIAPGSGSMVEAVITATGVQPVGSAGKPESAMYDEARALAAEDGEQMVAKERCLAIGDRLDTDVEAGNRGGYDSLVVLTGVATPHQIILAPRHQRPTFVAVDLRDLASPMPEPQQVSENEWTCGDATARLDGKALTVSDATDINALRAACQLMWSLADGDADFDVSAITLPEFKLGR